MGPKIPFSRLRGCRWRRSLPNGTGPILVAFLTSRLLVAALTLMSRSVVRHGPFWQPGGLRAVLVQWDGFWYLNIVRHGYTFSTHRQSSMGFFPLYPLVTKVASYIVPVEPREEYAALLVSNVCLIVACFLLYALIRVDYDDPRVGRAAVIFLLFSPVSFFFSGAFAESLFLMLAIGALLAAVKRRWLVASLLGMGAALTRHVGVLIVLPLVVEYVRQTWYSGARLRTLAEPRALSLALVPLGFLGFLTYGYLRFNNFLAYFDASQTWGRRLTSPIETIESGTKYSLLYTWLFFGLLVTAILLVVAGARLKVRPSYLAFSAALIGLYLSSGTMEAMPRLLSVVFPLFLVIALVAVKHRWSYEPMLAVSVAVLALGTVIFANGYWLT